MNNIQDKAMLAYVSISLPAQTKTDKRASATVEHDNETSSGRAKVVKRLFSKQAIGPVIAAAQRVRMLHYKLTLSWDDTGGRLLPITAVPEYMEKIQAAIDGYNKAVKEFADTYADQLDVERQRLGKLFNSSDYPTNPALGCSANYSLRAVPGDFKMFGWSDELAEQIAEQAQIELEQGVVNAMDDAFLRIHETVSKLVQRLADPDSIFRDSLLANVQDLACSLERMNIFGNARLADTVLKMRMLADVDPDDCRKDPAVRSQTVASADEILRLLKGN